MQRLLSGGSGGGFATWLATFTSAAALAAKSGQMKVDIVALKEAYGKAILRLKQAAGNGSKSDDQVSLAITDLLLSNL